MRLQDKVAIVTGAGQGIGRATALTFAREGAKVVVADINDQTIQSVAEEITSSGGQALPVQLNVASSESVDAMIKATMDWGSRLDVLVNNAGITKDARLQKMSEDQWDAVINVNLKGVWLCGKAAATIMAEQGSGSIANASSITGLYGNFGQSNYAATKGGVIAMTLTWAIELGPKGVRVNAIAPGFTMTPMLETVPEKVLDDIRGKTPLRRLGTPEDIANAYLFLASDESSFITGQVISVSGGILRL
ncbi:MAG: 3-oxoacyl-ACP reductase FabG [Chloroflexaceae bacterium]|nr:3-oxoacyl-ACP reductase FabG [Chloroflexaceae bacterium]NJL33689.1 3-oxoacyl-ACP reductase FabG [Chloroflexaceae bacterium]NJO04941.1 3-oxoacyl-ACP reductase FabG [Chloroflexaceae bacterium]